MDSLRRSLRAGAGLLLGIGGLFLLQSQLVNARPAPLPSAPPALPATGITPTWSIGFPDDSSAEFDGPDANPFRVGLDPWSAFPRVLAAGISQTVVFSANDIGPATLQLHGVDSAANTPVGLLITLNGHTLSPRWAASFASDAFGGWADREQGVILLRWALPETALITGVNSLTLRLMAADFDAPFSPSIELDALSLAAGSFQLPQRRVGSTEYWMNQELLDISKAENVKRGGTYATWINYLYDTGTLTSDLEMLEELHVTAAYPDVSWNFVEPDFDDDWRPGAYAFYHQTFAALQERDIRVLAKLQYTPQWASSNPTSPAFDIYPPADWSTWEDFCIHTAQVLSDVVDDWAVWNEVDHPSFWQPQPYQENGYDVMFTLAYSAFHTYDTVDADGDGIPARVFPSATDNPTDVGDWAWMVNTFSPYIDGLQVHDYMWGVLPDHLAIHALSPTLPYVVSEFGPAVWYVGAPPYDETNPAGPMSFDAYTLKSPDSPLEMAMQWILKGDPDKDAGPWPDPAEWVPLGGYANDDGFFESYGTSLVNLEPGGGGPPYTAWRLHSGGAYAQHQFWLYDMPGAQVPLEWLNPALDAAVELSAVDRGDRIEVLVTNFAGGTEPVSRTIWTRVHLPWHHLQVQVFDPDDPVASYRAAGPDLVLSATLALDTCRFVIRPGADLSPSDKTASHAEIVPGHLLTYTLFLFNGGDAAAAAWLTDTLPPEVAWAELLTVTAGSSGYAGGVLTWTGSLSAGTPVTLAYRVTVALPLDDGTLLSNTALLNDGAALFALGPATTVISSAPDLAGSWKGVEPLTVAPGGQMSYTLRLVNDGTMDVPTARLTDVLPLSTTYAGGLWWSGGQAGCQAGVVTWTGTLTVGMPVTVTYQVLAAPSLQGGTLITNTATIVYPRGERRITAPPVTVADVYELYLPVVLLSY
ncbi:MAG: DUF11 domain-containing protein [Anaerolineae bacterium]|nr:DUF11 domain-containing protein [Anaerolineae bacterium]